MVKIINKKENVFSLVKRIEKEAVNTEEMHTGLLGEKIIIASYNQMTLEQLQGMKKIIDRLIQKKVELKRLQ